MGADREGKAMSGARLTEEQKNEIIALYVAGVSTVKIAAQFNVDRSYPTLLAQRRGVSLRMNRHSRERMADAARVRHA